MTMELMKIDTIGLVLASSLVGYVFVFWFLKRVNEWCYCLGKKNLPPGDMGWPLIGNMISFSKAFKSSDPDSFHNNLVKRYGKVGMYKNHLLGKPIIIASRSELCKAILHDDENFKLGYPSLPELIGKRSIATIDGVEHKRLRKLTTAPINGHEALSMYIEYMEDVVMDSLDELSSMNKPVELLTELKRATFKVVTNIFFGPEGFQFLEPLTKLFHALSKGIFAAHVNLPGFSYYKALKARDKLVRIVDNTIEDRKVRNKSIDFTKAKKSMLDLLLEVEGEDGERMDNITIIDLLGSILITGHETTAIATMWLLLFLDENPQVYQKLKEEQEEIISKRPSTQKGLTMAEIKKMSYTDKVIQEVLRRANVGVGAFREAVNDVKLNGYTIPKRWKVFIMFRTIHLDPEIYPNPTAFNPSRWDNKNIKAGAYVPFGLGSRICPGNELAKTEMFVFLHCFVLNYKVERMNPKSPMVYFPTAEPKDKFMAKIRKLP
ncbi:beta-amyrin 11-oxidase-like [Tripterygium wilfordii]|uniref:beta-amyrin 11-oxidase-like n=1 Tax=Tripterygium wilfordii TaxID=458696 RepID=UPI0018F837E3|nr:beta-amyrin 11-oxidase-like [Tripterygium wilfordii]